MQSSAPILRIGTRGSPLALAQAHLVRNRLAALHGVDEAAIEIVVIATSGDRLKEQPLSAFGGKGLFSREIEEALIDMRVDIGVHSSKDMATTLPDGLVMPVFLEREDVRDAFVSLAYADLSAMPKGARFGTSSIRRAAQILRRRPDLEIVPFRGNVQTRLKKLADGVADATLLAAAGLNRLGMADRAAGWLDPMEFMPAPAQGAIGIEYRADDSHSAELVAPLGHEKTTSAVRAERAMLRILDGSCRTPIGALSMQEAGKLTLTGELLSPDGATWFRETLTGDASDPETVGSALGKLLLERAGPEFLKLF